MDKVFHIEPLFHHNEWNLYFEEEFSTVDPKVELALAELQAARRDQQLAKKVVRHVNNTLPPFGTLPGATLFLGVPNKDINRLVMAIRDKLGYQHDWIPRPQFATILKQEITNYY